MIKMKKYSQTSLLFSFSYFSNQLLIKFRRKKGNQVDPDCLNSSAKSIFFILLVNLAVASQIANKDNAKTIGQVNQGIDVGT